MLTVAEYSDIGEIPSGCAEPAEGRVIVVTSPTGDHNHAGFLDLTQPVSLPVTHRAGELGYSVTGGFTGRAILTEPFPSDLDLDALL